MPLSSPYQAVLGQGMSDLHPVLRRYFSAIPEGFIGVGEGVFTEFGTPKRWLWPLLRLFEDRGVLVAGYEQSVRFRVVNRTVAATNGSGLAVARRELQLQRGTWTMVDSVSVSPEGRIVDRLGSPRTVAVSFDVGVRGGGLTLRSRSVGLMLGRLRVRVPGLFAPVVRLSETHDPVNDVQRIELTIDAPVVGRVYEYRGYFEYEIVKEQE